MSGARLILPFAALAAAAAVTGLLFALYQSPAMGLLLHAWGIC